MYSDDGYQLQKIADGQLSANSIVRGKKGNRSEVYSYLMKQTAFMPEKSSIRARAWAVVNSVKQLPLCANGECSEPVGVYRGDWRNGTPFKDYCSKECQRLCSRTSRKFSDELKKEIEASPDWLYDKHIVQKLSLVAISKLYGPSETYLRRMIHHWEIDHVHYGQADPEMYKLVRDKDWLYEQYITKNLTISEIAELVGITVNTVRAQLAVYDITKPYYAYDRALPGRVSQPEQEIVNWLKELGVINILQSDRSLMGNGKELDIYLPDHNIAIEYNGLPWHSEFFGQKDQNYHINKSKACAEKGVQLFHIFSFEWKEEGSREGWKSLLQTKLGLCSKRVYARQCEVKRLTPSEGRAFVTANHIQKASMTNGTPYGLIYKGEIVQVMMFRKSISPKGYDYELSRFCSRSGWIVVGGSSKLLKHFLRDTPNATTIVSYANMRYSNGQLYTTLGFDHVSTSKPSYVYFHMTQGHIKSRFDAQKRNLAKWLDNYDPSLTEVQNMANHRYDRVWDCGTMTFVYTR